MERRAVGKVREVTPAGDWENKVFPRADLCSMPSEFANNPVADDRNENCIGAEPSTCVPLWAHPEFGGIFMLRLRLTLVVGMLGFLPVIATAQPTPCSACPVRSVPEPTTITLLASGVGLGLGVVRLLRGRVKNKK